MSKSRPQELNLTCPRWQNHLASLNSPGPVAELPFLACKIREDRKLMNWLT